MKLSSGCWRSLLAAAVLALAPEGRAALTSELVASGLDKPLFATFAPGDADRLFIVEQPGTIRILDIASQPPALLAAPFLDIQSIVNDSGGEQGLLGLAFHPAFQSNGFFYVLYTAANDDAVVARFHVPPGTPDQADAASELVLLTVPQPQSNHNGGWMAFGPNDGYLYIAMGDGGGSGDNEPGHTPDTGNSQDITDNLMGKILRIDVDGSNGPGGSYGIPPDNPFVGVEGDDEIWSFGLRNPWRNAFDRQTGDLYLADVGQSDWEELSFQPASSSGGENWGWRCREGAHDFDTTACGPGPLLDPILEYPHGGGRCSITGGEVYRGCAAPEIDGHYFYADFCSAQIWSVEVVNGVPTNHQERTAELEPPGSPSIGSITSFGLDAQGEMYILDRGGEVFRILPQGAAASCPLPVPSSAPAARLGLLLALLAAAGLALRRACR